MYKNILIPVELGNSDYYDEAHAVATNLLDEDGKITLIHSIEPIPTYADSYIPPDFEIKTRTGAQRDLGEVAAKLGVKSVEVVFGSAGRSIVDWAEGHDVDCIVIRSHRPVFSDIFLGSTAAWVVRHAKTSVHVVR